MHPRCAVTCRICNQHPSNSLQILTAKRLFWKNQREHRPVRSLGVLFKFPGYCDTRAIASSICAQLKRQYSIGAGAEGCTRDLLLRVCCRGQVAGSKFRHAEDFLPKDGTMRNRPLAPLAVAAFLAITSSAGPARSSTSIYSESSIQSFVGPRGFQTFQLLVELSFLRG